MLLHKDNAWVERLEGAEGPPKMDRERPYRHQGSGLVVDGVENVMRTNLSYLLLVFSRENIESALPTSTSDVVVGPKGFRNPF